MKNLWCLITTCIIAMAFASGDTVAFANSKTLQVMSYNIHFATGTDGIYDINRLSRVIYSSNADIVGLQEMDVNYSPRTHFQNQIVILANKLHMNYYFAPMYDYPPFYPPMYIYHPEQSSLRRQSGVAVLSKFPIIHAENHCISRNTSEETNPVIQDEPGFAETILNVYGHQIPVYVTHLDWSGDKRVRIMQIRDMVPIISKRHGQQILLGDLNASPWEPELAPLFERFQDPFASCHDACFTYPADAPLSRVDYVLATKEFKIVSAHVIDSKASDHRPVVATLTI